MFELRPYRRNSINAWNPFSEMEEMEKRLFNNSFFSNADLAEFKTDITDEGDHYLLKADLPGFKKEDIHLNPGRRDLCQLRGWRSGAENAQEGSPGSRQPPDLHSVIPIP